MCPAGPFLGVAWQRVHLPLLRRRRGAAGALHLPHVLLLSPALPPQESDSIAVHHRHHGASDELAPFSQEEPPLANATRQLGATEPLMLRVLAACFAAWLAVVLRAVPPVYAAFATAYVAYLCAANVWRFPAREPPPMVSTEGGLVSGWFTLYVAAVGLLAVIAPFCTIVSAPLLLDAPRAALLVKSASPQLFLLLVQLIMEGTMMANPRAWAALVRLLNPIGFSAARLVPLLRWGVVSSATVSLRASGAVIPSAARIFLVWNAALAGLNAALAVFNLFGILLLDALPRCLHLDVT